MAVQNFDYTKISELTAVSELASTVSDNSGTISNIITGGFNLIGID